MEPFFVFFKRIMAAILLKTSYFIVHVLGYEANVYRRIIWIEGSEGVKIINACMAWPVMALFAGFIIIYPGDKRSKYWFIPSGIVAIIIMNVLRITAMTIISYEAPHTLDAYHRYVFNLVLYVVVFSLWAVWVRKFGRK